MKKIRFQKQLVKDHTKNPTYSKSTWTVNDALIMDQLSETLKDTETLVQSFKLKDSVPFLFWNNLLNEHTLKAKKYDSYRTNNAGVPIRYSRGHKVLIDFGYGIDRELFQPHPAIILADFEEMIAVVPTTSDDGSGFNEKVKKAIIQIPNDTPLDGKKPIFPKPTIINLHQIRVVSKNRVQINLNCNVQNYILPDSVINQLNRYLPYPVLQNGDHLLQAIEVKISHLYAPDTLYQIKNLHNDVKRLQADIKDLNNQITSLSDQ